MKKKPAQKIAVAVLVFIGILFTAFAAYPGFMSPDSLDQYGQALNGSYTDWHPPVMAWIWHQLLPLTRGPQPMMMLNILLYWSAVAIVALHIRSFILSILFVTFSFAPPLINFLGVIWKDSLLFSMLFFISALLFRFHDKAMRPLSKALLVVVIVILSLVAISLRYNAFIAVVPILTLGFYFWRKQKQAARSLLYGLIITTVLWARTSAINGALCRQKSLHPQQQLMVYDLMGISYRTHQNVFPAYLAKRLTLDTLPKVYSPCDGALFVIFGMGCTAHSEAQFDSLKSCWIREVIHHPMLLFKHKIRSFHCLVFESGLHTFPFIHENPYGFHVKQDNPIYRLFVKYTESRLAHRSYHPFIYLAGCALVLLLSFLRFRLQKVTASFVPCMIALSGLLYSVAYLPLSPCNDFRYHYWTIGACFLSSFLFLNTFTKHN